MKDIWALELHESTTLAPIVEDIAILRVTVHRVPNGWNYIYVNNTHNNTVSLTSRFVEYSDRRKESIDITEERRTP
jgi:hypothetical protein